MRILLFGAMTFDRRLPFKVTLAQLPHITKTVQGRHVTTIEQV